MGMSWWQNLVVAGVILFVSALVASLILDHLDFKADCRPRAEKDPGRDLEIKLMKKNIRKLNGKDPR